MQHSQVQADFGGGNARVSSFFSSCRVSRLCPSAALVGVAMAAGRPPRREPSLPGDSGSAVVSLRVFFGDLAPDSAATGPSSLRVVRVLWGALEFMVVVEEESGWDGFCGQRLSSVDKRTSLHTHMRH